MKNVVTFAALAAASLGIAAQSQAATITYNSSIADSGQVNSVDYYSFSTVANDNVTIETFSENFDSVLYLFRDTGNGLATSDLVAWNDDGGDYASNPYGFFNSLLNLELDIGDYITAVGDFQLTLNEAVSGINDSSALGSGSGDYTLVISGLTELDNTDNSGGSDNGSDTGNDSGSDNGSGTGGSGSNPEVGVSEPMTLSLFGLALAGFGALRRKKS